MSRRWPAAAVVVGLLLATGAAIEWSGRVPAGIAFEPAHLTLRVGEEREVRLTSHERDIVAYAFRLRFDPAVVTLRDPRPEQRALLDGGNAILSEVQREPGLLHVPGVAVTGGRMLTANTPLYRVTVRGVGPGATRVAIEGCALIDNTDARLTPAVTDLRITVEAP